MQPNILKWCRGWALVGTLSLIIVSIALGIVLSDQGSVESVRLVIRVTARTSLLLFCLAFTAAAFYRLWPNDWTRWQRQNRRYLGVSFAGSHAVHAVAIAGFALLDPVHFHEMVNIQSYIFGGTGYAFIVAMTATSFDSSAAWIGPRAWKLLHTAGAYYLWFTFMSATAKRAVMDPFYWPFVAVLVAVMVVRIFSYYRIKYGGAPGQHQAES
jgi:hypothetical protein